MSSPLISVLLPCFNDGAWIDTAVRSVLDQTRQDFEIIVVDDGSTDPGTVERLDGIDIPQVRILRTENRGLPAARNHAAAHARGEVLCALDADDRLAPAWLEKGCALLSARPEVAFVSHWLQTFGDEEWTWKPERCDLPALLARNTVNGAALVRRRAFDAVHGYDESMRQGCEDWDFWLRLVEAGYEGTIIPEVLFYYRRRPGSMSRTMTGSTAYAAALKTLLAKHAAYYREHLVEIVAIREAERLALEAEVAALESDRLLVLEPALDRALEELQAIQAREQRVRMEKAAEEARERLSWEVSELRRQLDALHASWSWRITAPLRRLYAALQVRGHER